MTTRFNEGDIVRYPGSEKHMTIQFGPFRTHAHGDDMYLARRAGGTTAICLGSGLERVREDDTLVDTVAQWLLDGEQLDNLSADSLEAYRTSARDLINRINEKG